MVTVAVPISVPLLYTRMVVPGGYVEVPVMEVAPAEMGIFRIGAAEGSVTEREAD